MIRRLFLAIVLIVVALGVMHFAIGFENFASTGSGGSKKPVESSRRPPPEIVIGNPDGDRNSAVAVSMRGRFQIEPKVEITLADGSRRRLRRYRFVAEDSATVSSDLVHLDRVTVDVYRVDRTTNPPSEKAVAKIVAREALVQIGRDEEGRPSIREDRDMDLADIVLTSVPGSSQSDIRIAIARALVRQDDSGIHLRTPDDQVPFEAKLLGAGEVTMTGRGVDGFVPRGEDEVGGTLRFDIANDPVVRSRAGTLQASGKLQYREDVATGFGRLTMRNAVRILGEFAGGKAVNGEAEELIALLQRNTAAPAATVEPLAGGDGAWRNLLLRGAPVRVAFDTFVVRCAELVVRPSLAGEPAVIVADGNPQLDDPARGISVRCKGRASLVDLERWLAPQHRLAGGNPLRLGFLARWLLRFEEQTTLTDHKKESTIVAKDGIRILAGDAGLAIARTANAAMITSPELLAESAKGFVYSRSPLGERMQLGEDPAAPSRFHVETVPTKGQPIVVDGTGRCVIERSTLGSVALDLRSDVADVTVQSDRGKVVGVAALEASIEGREVVRSIVASGPAVEFATTLDVGKGRQEAIRTFGERIETWDGQRLVVLGSPARVEREGGGTLVGGRIDVVPHSIGQPAIVVRGTPAEVRGAWTKNAVGAAAESAELSSRRITFLPTLLPRAVLVAHGLGSRWTLAITQPAVLADRDVLLVRRDVAAVDQGRSQGDRLFLLPSSAAAMLHGSPAVLERIEPSGRRLLARGDRLRGVQAAGGSRIELWPGPSSAPEIDLLAPAATVSDAGERTDGGDLDNLRVIASSPIVLTDDELMVDGTSRILALRRDASIDPLGLDVTTLRLRAALDRTSGSVQSLAATHASMLWRGMRAFAEQLTIDVPRHQLDIQSSTDDGAWLEMNGWRYTGGMIQVDYLTREWRAWKTAARRVDG
ncbi:MAG: hypothetical protein AB7I19_04770 [Planctomycetota bacterium]